MEISILRTRYTPYQFSGKSKRPPKKIQKYLLQVHTRVLVATRLLHTEIFLTIISRIDRLDRNVQIEAPITKENVRASLDTRDDKKSPRSKSVLRSFHCGLVQKRKKIVQKERKKDKLIYVRRLREVYTIKSSCIDIFVTFH